MLKLFFCFGISIFALTLHAQIEFEQKLDTQYMLIGDQQYLHLTNSDKEIGEYPIAILDTLTWLQIIDKGIWMPKDQNFERNILFTVFDSGYFKIPSLGFYSKGDSIIVSGNPLFIEVNNPQDSLNILRPIKFIEVTQVPFKYFYLILGVFLIAGMLFVLWQFFKADRIRPGVIQLTIEKKIWEQSLQYLMELDQKKLWQNNKIKEHYDELNFILRNFLSAGLKIPAMENTSSEIIELIANNYSEIKNTDNLAGCFRESDFVKFANFTLVPEKNALWMEFAKKFIEDHKELSEVVLEETRTHWLTLLGDTMGQQFENPFETVPSELIQLFDNSKTGTFEMLHNLVSITAFQLPDSWIKWHAMHTGIFYRWQLNILSISKHKIIQIMLMIFVIPFIALFLPFIIAISIFKKQNLFSRGVFGLSANNKLVHRKSR